MTNRKSQNSILFLTTLGVYLGLVLVGATPQVLAQAATAKQFSVKDEIEVKDDVDDEPRRALLKKYGAAVAFFFKAADDIANRSSIDRDSYGYNFQALLYGSADGSYDHFTTLNFHRPRFTLERPNILLQDLFEGFAHSSEPGKRQFLVDLFLDRDSLGFSVTFHPVGLAAAETCHSYLPSEKYNRASTTDRIVLDNTSCTVVDNLVIIATRLPRGSLDSPLATDAK